MPDQPTQQSTPPGPGTPGEQESRTSSSRKLIERPSFTERSRNIGERIVETGIFCVATLSIVFIFLIFFFIFREASPIFFGESGKKEKPAVVDQYLLPGETLPADTAAAVADTTKTAAPVIAADTGAPVRPWFVDEGYPLLEHESPVKLSYLLHDNWQPNSEHPRYGIYPIVVGTLKTTFIALLIATPIAILAALYTAFFAPKRLRETLKPVIEILAGFPSVVIGFFCMMTVATIVQAITGTPSRLNAVVGGIGLALAVIPIIYTITDDALRAVPLSLREAALAIGASEWQAAYQIMLPAATPGIVAAVLLGLGRAFGETMIALIATGNAVTFNWNFFDPVRTFAATIGAEMGEVVFGSPHYQVLFLLGIILFVFSFAINFITEFYVKQRLIKKFRGGE